MGFVGSVRLRASPGGFRKQSSVRRPKPKASPGGGQGLQGYRAHRACRVVISYNRAAQLGFAGPRCRVSRADKVYGATFAGSVGRIQFLDLGG